MIVNRAILVVLVCFFLAPRESTSQVSDVRAKLEQELDRYSRSLKANGNQLEFLATANSDDDKKTLLQDKSVVQIDTGANGKVKLFVERFVGVDPVSKSQQETIVDGKRQVYALRIPDARYLMVISDNEAAWLGKHGLAERGLFVGGLMYGKSYKSFDDVVAEARKSEKVKLANKMMGQLSAEYELKDKNKFVFSFDSSKGNPQLVSFQFLRTYPPEITAKYRQLKAQKKYSDFKFENMKNRLSSFTVTEKAWYEDGVIRAFEFTYKLLSEKKVERRVSGVFEHIKVENGTTVHVKDEPGLRFKYHDGKIVEVVDD